MTVASTTNRKTFAGDSVTTSFGTSPVVFFDSADLTIFVVNTTSGAGTTLVENTDYTVTGGDGSTGTVNLAGGSDPWGALATGTTLVILRDLDLVQEADFVQNDGSDAEVTEDALDKLTMMAQQLSTQINRSFTLADSDVSGASTEIPTPEANTVVGWNSAGTALQNYSAVDLDLALTTPFTLTLLDDTTAAAARTTLDVSQAINSLTAETAPAVGDLLPLRDISEGADNKITLSNLWTVVNAFTQDLSPDKTADYVASYDASAAAVKKILLQDMPLPLMSISGLTYGNGDGAGAGDLTNDITITAGSCRDSTGAANLSRTSSITKQLDAAWAVGSAAGGLDTGAIGNSDYYIWLIKRSDTGVVDALFSLSSTAPTMPTSYDFKRLIGWFKRVGGAIVAFNTYETEGGGLEFQWSVPTTDVNLANTLTTSRRTDAVKVPLNFSVQAHINVVIADGAATVNAWVYCPDQADTAPASTALENIYSTASANGVRQLFVRTSATGTVAARADVATVDSYLISTIGFRWARRNS